MEISPSQLGTAVHMAVQKNVLDQIKAQGEGLVALITASPMGSVNLPHQGQHLDVTV
jgi:hypothetical protein